MSGAPDFESAKGKKPVPAYHFAGKLSVILPVYNEAGVIAEIIRDIDQKIIQRIPQTQLIIAEDGSTDGTKEILTTLKSQVPFTLISGLERKGYTRAFTDALGNARTELVFFCDSDGQHEPGDFFKLLKEIGEFDIVSGYKSPRQDPLPRRIISLAHNCLVALLFGLKLKDIDSGFKLIRKPVLDEMLTRVGKFRYCVMSEFIIKAYLSGYRIKEVAVTHFPRKSGVTNIFTPSRLPLIIMKVFRDLFELKFNYPKKVAK